LYDPHSGPHRRRCLRRLRSCTCILRCVSARARWDIQCDAVLYSLGHTIRCFLLVLRHPEALLPFESGYPFASCNRSFAHESAQVALVSDWGHCPGGYAENRDPLAPAPPQGWVLSVFYSPHILQTMIVVLNGFRARLLSLLFDQVHVRVERGRIALASTLIPR